MLARDCDFRAFCRYLGVGLMHVPSELQELRGIGLAGYEAPEWKAKALGKAPTFGYSDVRPIKEQRESLPVFKLRDQLIQAVNEHQVCASHPTPITIIPIFTPP